MSESLMCSYLLEKGAGKHHDTRGTVTNLIVLRLRQLHQQASHLNGRNRDKEWDP